MDGFCSLSISLSCSEKSSITHSACKCEGANAVPHFSNRGQYSHRQELSAFSPSAFRVPPWSPRRYLPFLARIAIRPCSRNSKKKSSGVSPSEHTSPGLETYQNFPPTPRRIKFKLMLALFLFLFSKLCTYLLKNELLFGLHFALLRSS